MLKSLNSDKTPGPDNVYPQLKNCAQSLAKPLFVVCFLNDDKLPREWKWPILQENSKNSANNIGQ